MLKILESILMVGTLILPIAIAFLLLLVRNNLKKDYKRAVQLGEKRTFREWVNRPIAYTFGLKSRRKLGDSNSNGRPVLADLMSHTKSKKE